MYKIKRVQYAVYEKVPAHGGQINGVILAPFNTEKEAQDAGEKYGYNTDNYYVDKL
jgi:hypothetical protein